MQIINDVKLDFDDVLLVPKHSTITSRSDVELIREFKFKYSTKKWNGVPIISANMDTVTTRDVVFEMEKHNMLAASNKCEIGASISHFIQTIKLTGHNNFLFSNLLFLCIDAANGYMEKFVDKVKWARSAFPEKIIIAGNVVTPEMVQTLILAGADVVKVGIGSGAVCTTRLVAGVGYPQLSAVIECSDAAHGLNGHIISDGGCTKPADVVKAFAAGADFVMLGSMLAGHTENWQEGFHYGMSSTKANDLIGGLKDYKASEGREVVIPHRGPLAKTLQEITGGLRSACSYVGARKLKDLPKCATFIRVNNTHNKSLEEFDV